MRNSVPVAQGGKDFESASVHKLLAGEDTGLDGIDGGFEVESGLAVELEELAAVALRAAAGGRIDHPGDPRSALFDGFHVDVGLVVGAVMFRVQVQDAGVAVL